MSKIQARATGAIMRRALLLGAVALLAAVASPAPAVAGTFLKLANVLGDSTAENHVGEIDILTFTQSFTRSGPRLDKVQCGPITLMKNIDSSSPELLKLVATARHAPSALLTFQSNSTPAADYYTISMIEVDVIELTQTDAADSARIVEKVVLAARRFIFTFFPQSETGGNASPVQFGWDCVTNSSL